jgi:hypothetical protein
VSGGDHRGVVIFIWTRLHAASCIGSVKCRCILSRSESVATFSGWRSRLDFHQMPIFIPISAASLLPGSTKTPGLFRFFLLGNAEVALI